MSALSVRGLRKRLGGRQVLDGASFDLEPPGVVAVVGENGSGKTTLLSIIAGVLLPDAGTVMLDGVAATGGEARVRRRLGYVPEAAAPLPHLTVAELIDLVAALKRAPPVPESVLERLGVERLLHQPVAALSLGERRRACLAAALVGNPWLLVLDEPTNGLDPGGMRVVADLLRERSAGGMAALIATHDLAFAAAVSARLLRLENGRLAPERALDAASRRP